jgi:uncharacterized membrane protein/protein-disulfide isomerase
MENTSSSRRNGLSEWFRRRSKMLVDYNPSAGPYFTGRRPFLILLILALIGTFAAGFLTYRHLILVSSTGGVPESALCRAQGNINCDAILMNDYATVLGYFSSSALGLMGFVFVLWIVLNGLWNERMRKIAWTFLAIYFFAAIGFSWYYIYIMMFVVDYICTWCIVVHVVNFTSLAVVLVVAIKNRDNFLLKEISTRGERFYFVGSGVVLSVLSLVATTTIEKTLVLADVHTKFEELANDPAVIAAVLKSSPSYEIPVSSNDPVYGSPSAPHNLIFFSDFQCPVCARTESYLKKIVNMNEGTINIVYKNFPLSTECNSSVLGNLHPMACLAARAAYGAYLVGGSKGFWSYGDMLFENQKLLNKNPWLRFAQTLGFDVSRFEEMLGPESQAAKKIEEDVALGIKLKLNSTPQLFFKGKRIPENFRGHYLVEALEELAKAENPDNKDFQLKRP